MRIISTVNNIRQPLQGGTSGGCIDNILGREGAGRERALLWLQSSSRYIMLVLYLSDIYSAVTQSVNFPRGSLRTAHQRSGHVTDLQVT